MVCYSKAEAWFFGGRTLTYRNESNLLIYHGSSLYYNPAAARAKNIKNKKDLVQDREHLSRCIKVCSSNESIVTSPICSFIMVLACITTQQQLGQKNIRNKKDLVWDREYVIQDDLKSIRMSHWRHMMVDGAKF